MSIKDLFDKGHSLKFVKNKTQDDLTENVESHRYIDAYAEKRSRFIPNTNFATASNFARFGLAEEYYDVAIKRIYQTYPYDGSQAEKIEWENDSTYLDLFLFENEYPRTNGFVTINSGSNTYTDTKDSNNHYSSSVPQYIFIKGGPNPDPAGYYKSDFFAGPSLAGVSKANIYHTGSQRTNNLEIDLDKGLTVEFWMKKDSWASTDVQKIESIFHIAATGSTGNSYGSLELYMNGLSTSNLGLNIHSGSSLAACTFETSLSTIADGLWHHYAVTAKKTSSTTTTFKLYVDGEHQNEQNSSTVFSNPIDGTLVASLGSLAAETETDLSEGGAGLGNVVATSFDEFRYWKTERSPQQIGRFYRDQIGGGTNTDNIKYDDISNKVDLGVYYKFNEGVTGISSTDSIILDYSGRISNGAFENYSSECRNTDSAIVLSNSATKEFKDPILYSTHTDVADLINSKQLSGSMHDHENSVSLYKSLPGWLMEEDEEESNHLKYMIQIIASYFDDLYLQIQQLSRLKDINYPDDTEYEKPLPFADRLLSSRNFDVPELFSDVSDLAKYLDRDEKILFEKKLYEVKNIIYQNIYNNLSFIQKSKGTIKSLRNFLRCFGVDEELIKLNIYSNNDTYKFKDTHTNTSIRKRYADFDDIETRLTASEPLGDAYAATVYQYYDSSDPNSLSYIPAAEETLLTGAMMTIETEVIFPKRSIVDDKNYQMFPATESSIFGLHAVIADNENLAFAASDTINFNIVANKPDNDLRNVKFALKSSGSSVFDDLENTSSYLGVYDNEKWNLAFRLRPTKSKTDTNPALNTISGFLEPAASAYTYELYGVNYLSNILQNEFALSGTISLSEAQTFFKTPKRIFLGAARTNFSGSVEKYSDVKVSSTRVWLDYLPNEVIQAHAKDASSYGALHPYRNTNDSLNANYVPQISTLIMNWTMDNLTGSNSDGQFSIQDFASGSNNDRLRFGDNWSKPISKYNYTGRGDKFVSNTDFTDQAIDIEFVPSAKLKLPEVVGSDDMIKILNKQDDVVFTRETTYVQHLLSVEKSMYQVISEEMLKLFATVTNFNNLVGEPVNRYRPNYKKLEKLREFFFESVENDRLDLEKFVEYFKWIDDAVSIMIAQLIPVSSNSVELLRNMIESHILERNKYHNKFPTLEGRPHEPVSSLKAIEELKYNWKFGHAPVNANQNTNQDQNCLWWKQRAERDGVLTSGVSSVDSNKDTLLKISVTEVTGAAPTLKTSAATRYVSSYYHNRSLARPIDLTTHRSLKLKAGSNSEDNKIHDFYKSIITWGSDDDFIYLDADNEISRVKCNDQEIPPELDKKEFRMKALIMRANETIDSDAQGTGGNDSQYTDAKSSLVLPFSIFSSSIDTGYRQQYKGGAGTMPKIEFANMHDDKYGPHAEIPLQGPFTEKYVGGMQHRHVKLNQGSDTHSTRPEGWILQEFIDQSFTEYVIQENFANAPTTATTDVSILNLPLGSVAGDPSGYELWSGPVGSDNIWSFLSGPTSTAGTGPAAGAYAYCEVLPEKVGQTFGLATPLIDLLDMSSTDTATLKFKYHMHGINIGSLKVQISRDSSFATDVTDIFGPISGQQHPNPADNFTQATVDISSFTGRRFYIKFLYTAAGGHLGDCAIDDVDVYKSGGDTTQNSFKLFSPTFDNHDRPAAIYTRGTLVKRPINIRNIEMTGNMPTVAGNYLDRYEYISTTSPEANDPWFVKNVNSLTRTTSEILGLGTGSIEELLSIKPGKNRASLQNLDFTLADRDYLTGSIRNRTRFRTKFSAPGGFEVMSRGFLDIAHETYSVYNAMPWRNNWGRKVYNSQLQAHMGRFGVSTHDATTSRVYGSEAVGTINSADYTITGDASKHKYHRNNAERIVLSGSMALSGSVAAKLNGTNQYFTAADNDTLSFGDLSVATEKSLTFSAWINMTDATQFQIIKKSTEYKFFISGLDKPLLYLYYDQSSKYIGQQADNAITSHQGKWIHVAATYDASRVSAGIKLYVNGFLVDSSATESGDYLYMDNNATGLEIGKSSSTYAEGSIDEVSIWGAELNANEILQLYNGGKFDDDDAEIPGPGLLTEHTQASNLISWWRMGDTGDDLSGTVPDRKGSNDLTAQNSPTATQGPFPGLGNVLVTGSLHDNAFVSHMIPRMDKQTRWIAGSII